MLIKRITGCFLILSSLDFFEACHLSNSHGNSGDIKIKDSNVSIAFITNCCNDKYESNKGYKTSGQQLYKNYFPVSQINCFSYRVKSKNQTHIGLFSSNVGQKRNPWIEIVIGGLPDGLGNIFRRNGVDVSGTYNQQQNSLNEYEYRGFWISWAGGNIKVGYRGQPPFMTWQDPQPFKVNNVGVDTCCGTIGHVIVEEPKCPGINI